jgi:hypothetical protein
MSLIRNAVAALAAVIAVGAGSAGSADAGGHGYKHQRGTYTVLPAQSHDVRYSLHLSHQFVRVAAPPAHHHGHGMRTQTIRVPVLTCHCARTGCQQYMNVRVRH